MTARFPLLPVQTYLLTHSLADLFAEHRIKSRFSSSGARVTLNYEADARAEPFVEDCRGLVLGCDPTAFGTRTHGLGPTTVRARPFQRFYGWEPGVEIDFSDPGTVVTEKLDGTLVIAYWADNRWCVGTRSTPDADVPSTHIKTDGRRMTFRELFDSVPRAGDVLRELDPGFTYCFELTGPSNSQHVRYPAHDLTLIAVRESLTGAEEDIHRPGYVAPAGCPVPAVHRLPTMLDVRRFVESRPAEAAEGVVVRTRDFKRYKLKSTAYLAAAHAVAGGGTWREIVRLVLLGVDDDAAVASHPRVADRIRVGRDLVWKWLRWADAEYAGAVFYAGGTAGRLDRRLFADRINRLPQTTWTTPFYRALTSPTGCPSEFVRQLAVDGKLTDSLADCLLRAAGVEK